MSELIPHIEMLKTGTTALHVFFFNNRDKLTEQSWGCPEMTVQLLTPWKLHSGGRLFLESCDEGNNKLAKRYLGREELFPAVEGECIVWEPNRERIAVHRELFRKECEKDIRRPKLNNVMSFGIRYKNKTMGAMHAIKEKLDAHRTKPRQG